MTAFVTRLHITPLDSKSLPTILGPATSKLATNISYHSLQTFPENGYGYVDLPPMEAEKIKKKLNGAILRGKKIKVEEARPTKRKHIEERTEGQQDEEPSISRPAEARKKSRKESSVISGLELSPERKVKRGWTETRSDHSNRRRKDKPEPDAKSQTASKYTEKEELLFKTKIPGNKISRERKDAKRVKKARGSSVVHEFEKSSTVPSFLRNEALGGNGSLSYEDGKGWVDIDGKVVEKEDKKASKRRRVAQLGIEIDVLQAQSAQVVQPKPVISTTSQSSSNPTSTSSSSDHSRSDSDMETAGEQTLGTDADETSSSGSSGEDVTSEAVSASESDTPDNEFKHLVQITPPQPSVHPLEALFKKPTKPASSHAADSSQDVAKPSLEVQTSFSFFEHRDDQDGLPPMPMTPFSSQDIRTRETRSAAPTPDTAHPSRMNSVFHEEESEGELSEMEDSNEATWTAQRQSSESRNLEIPQTDFEKQFWENRGENNRAWKARRRAVLKEKRQRENRARRPKNW